VVVWSPWSREIRQSVVDGTRCRRKCGIVHVYVDIDAANIGEISDGIGGRGRREIAKRLFVGLLVRSLRLLVRPLARLRDWSRCCGSFRAN
jgi:hypothetical protein